MNVFLDRLALNTRFIIITLGLIHRYRLSAIGL
jgi:hypothetical protein